MSNLNNLIVDYHFSTLVIKSEAPEFLSATSEVLQEHLEKIKTGKPLDTVYPFYSTENIYNDNRLTDFCNYIGNTSWTILDSQGYNMDLYATKIIEMWGQSHHKTSGMEQHIHNNGAQISGFYFIDCPPDGNKFQVHDPRVAKNYTALYERDPSTPSSASSSIIYDASPGSFVFMNAWTAHTFTRNASYLPFNFIHFNVGVIPKEEHAPSKPQDGGVVII